MKYLTAAQYAKKHGKSRQYVAKLVAQGEIPCWRPDGKAIFIDEKLPWPKKLGDTDN